MAACMTPGFHSPATMRDWPRPIVATRARRAATPSQRTSGCMARKMAILRQARAAKPPKPSIMSAVMAQGPMPPLEGPRACRT